jgi:hypothetical protein
MTTIVTRAGKGSALTWTEGDSNFTNLNTAKLENIVEDISPQLGGNLDVNGQSIVSVSNGNISITPNGTGKVILDNLSWPTTDGTANQTLITDGAGNLSFANPQVYIASTDGNSSDTTMFLGLLGAGSTGFQNLHVDTGITANASTNAITATTFIGNVSKASPLNLAATGGTGVNINLVSNSLLGAYRIEMTASTGVSFVNGLLITPSGTNLNLDLTPDGTGDVNLNADTVRVGDANAAATITTNGTGDLTLSTNAGTNSGTIVIANGANGNITLTPNGTGDVLLVADTLQIGDANAAATLTTNGTGNLTLSTNNGTNSGTILITQGANADIIITPNGTGDVDLVTDTVIIGDANANATLTTNGTGDLILNTNNGTNSGSITIADASNGDITIAPNGTGSVIFSDKTIRQMYLRDYAETVHNLGNTGGSLAIDPSNGNLQRVRLTSNWTFTGFTNGLTGHTVTVMVVQDGTGGRTLIEGLGSAGAMLFAGGSQTLSTAANAIDFLTITLIDNIYYCSLAKGFA